MGSCFTESIGNRFTELKMQADVNPFGIIYNPASICNSFMFLIRNHQFGKEDLHFFNEQWHSFYHHGRFSDSNMDTCLDGINQRVSASGKNLVHADFIFITLGTAYVYRHIKTNEIVANCHKFPAKEFSSRMLSVSEIADKFSDTLNELAVINPGARIIFTLSPVRHWKDGAERNHLGKATLLLAIHRLINEFSNVSYFPAYEIMMDDLRDYRFYADDMLHPGQIAVNYIWHKFSEIYFDEETITVQDEIEKINKALRHKPFNPESEMYKKFMERTSGSVERLKKQYPYINFPA